MMDYITYSVNSGIVHATFSGMDEDDMIATMTSMDVPDLEYIEAIGRTGEQYVKNGMVIDLPEKPEPWLSWVLASESWEDLRTPQDFIDELNKERSRMQCSPLQGKLALGEARWLQVETLLASPETPFAMRIAITSAVVWYRNSQTIDELMWLMGLSPEEVDDLFRLAMTIIV